MTNFNFQEVQNEHFQCAWPGPSDEEKYLFALADEYHIRAEEYDRSVCTGPIRHGAIMPASPSEMMQINRNALGLMRELEQRAFMEHRIEAREVRSAIARHDR